ncbi:MAG: HAD family hydrolase [Candidatus Moranbacteria bacterium]|nr:HAD family hydrolase [Candidatus Moranbacteria bacterium]
MEPKKTIFFDVYQTLLSANLGPNEKGWPVFSDFLNDLGVSVEPSQFQEKFDQQKQNFYLSVSDPERKFRHHNLFDLINSVFRAYGIQAEKKTLLDLIWKFRKMNCPHVALYPEVKSVLEELSQKYSLSVASFAQSSYTKRELEELGIAKYFSRFIFSSDIGYKKTDPEFYRICLRITGKKPEECLMVGDNYLQDIVIPKSVGLYAILIRNPLTDKQNNIGDIKPDKILNIEDIVALPTAVRSIS